jgi:hypothetical protein
MSYSRDFFGTTHTIPARRESSWASWVSNLLLALVDRLNGTPQDITAGTAATAIDLSDGHNIDVSLESSTAITLTNPYEGDRYLFVFDQTGSFGVTWTNSIKWRGGSPPTITPGSGSVDIITLFYHPDLGFIGDFSQDYS